LAGNLMPNEKLIGIPPSILNFDALKL